MDEKCAQLWTEIVGGPKTPGQRRYFQALVFRRETVQRDRRSVHASASRTTSTSSGSRVTTCRRCRPRSSRRLGAARGEIFSAVDGLRRSRDRCRDPGERDSRSRQRAATPSNRARLGLESAQHFRIVRRRAEQRDRPRRQPGRRAIARANLQPAFHLRRRRARQDAPDAGDRPIRRRQEEKHAR